jgi:hypothetical protein
MATWPRYEAGTLLNPPRKAPTGVRTALAITTSLTDTFLAKRENPAAGENFLNCVQATYSSV